MSHNAPQPPSGLLIFSEGGDPPRTPPALDAYFRLGFSDVGGLQTLRAAGHLELHPVPFAEALEARGMDGAEVDEHVLAAFLRDESETLCIVEPLHCAACHDVPLLFLLWSFTLR